MICHQKKCIFIHIPKTAGQSVEQVFLDVLGLNWKSRGPLLLCENTVREVGPPRLAHLLARDYVRYGYLSQELFDRYYKFAIVRNPWSRAVSLYNFMGFGERLPFEQYVKNHLRSQVTDTTSKPHWFVGPQSDYIYDKDNSLLVDYVGRFEDLKDSFDIVSDAIGLPGTRLPHVNHSRKRRSVSFASMVATARRVSSTGSVGKLPKHKDFRQYYSNESIELVGELYAADVKNFAYSFE